MSRFSLWFSLFALFVSCTIALMTLSRDYQWAGDTIYSLSIWSTNSDDGVTLNLYGVIPIGSCYLGGRDEEEAKRCVIGHDRYWRFHQPLEKSEG